MRWIPAKRVREPDRRFDLAELARQVEQIAVGRLHSDPKAAADLQVDLDAGRVKPRGTPPLPEFLGLGQRREYGFASGGDDPLEPQHESLASRHSQLPLTGGVCSSGARLPRVMVVTWRWFSRDRTRPEGARR
jgi:hypothetical protein